MGLFAEQDRAVFPDIFCMTSTLFVQSEFGQGTLAFKEKGQIGQRVK